MTLHIAARCAELARTAIADGDMLAAAAWLVEGCFWITRPATDGTLSAYRAARRADAEV